MKTKGLYYDSYNIKNKEYKGINYSRKCFLFPGQGSAYPEMMKDLLNIDFIKEKFNISDELAKRNNLGQVSNYILNPKDINNEELHIIRNLALYTLEVSLFDYLIIEKKIKPEILTGHSFGEYSVLVCSGVISFEDMFEIILFREKTLPKPNQAGYMMAIKIGIEELEKIKLKTKFEISNINSNRQVVISVDNKENLKNICEEIEKLDLKSTILESVPQPYHSSYLNPYKKNKKKYIK